MSKKRQKRIAKRRPGSKKDECRTLGITIKQMERDADKMEDLCLKTTNNPSDCKKVKEAFENMATELKCKSNKQCHTRYPTKCHR